MALGTTFTVNNRHDCDTTGQGDIVKVTEDVWRLGEDDVVNVAVVVDEMHLEAVGNVAGQVRVVFPVLWRQNDAVDADTLGLKHGTRRW